jgi:hypothetical protein
VQFDSLKDSKPQNPESTGLEGLTLLNEISHDFEIREVYNEKNLHYAREYSRRSDLKQKGPMSIAPIFRCFSSAVNLHYSKYILLVLIGSTVIGLWCARYIV